MSACVNINEKDVIVSKFLQITSDDGVINYMCLGVTAVVTRIGQEVFGACVIGIGRNI